MRMSLPEEVILLTLDDETGRPVGRQGMAAGFALAGAVMMELALAGRVDTDLDRLLVVDESPTGDGVLDLALARLVAEAVPDSRGALLVLSREESALREALLDRLVAKGVLRRVEGRILFVLPDRRYPKAEEGGQATEEARARLRRTVLGTDSIPEPRDALLLGLARAAGLLPLLLSPEELSDTQDRLETLVQLEALNRSLATVVADLTSRGPILA